MSWIKNRRHRQRVPWSVLYENMSGVAGVTIAADVFSSSANAAGLEMTDLVNPGTGSLNNFRIPDGHGTSATGFLQWVVDGTDRLIPYLDF